MASTIRGTDVVLIPLKISFTTGARTTFFRWRTEWLKTLNVSGSCRAELQWYELMLMALNLPWLYVSDMPLSVYINSCGQQQLDQCWVRSYFWSSAVLHVHSPDFFLALPSRRQISDSQVQSVLAPINLSCTNSVAFQSAVSNHRQWSCKEYIMYSQCLIQPVNHTVMAGKKTMWHWVTATIQQPRAN